MRRLLSVVMLLGLTAAAVAQTPQAPPVVRMSVEGGNVISNGTTVEYTGGVKFTINGVEISADEATSDKRTGVLSLRGNVQVKLVK